MSEGNSYKLAIVALHPVPYHVSFFRALHRHERLEAEVIYLASLGLEPKYIKEFRSTIEWDIPLLEGYKHTFLRNYTLNDQIAIFGRINPGLISQLTKGQYNAVLITGYTMISSYLALLIAKAVGSKVLLRAEVTLGNPSTKLRRQLKANLLGHVLRSFDAIMYSCEANRQYFQHYGTSDERLFPLLSSVDNDYFLSSKRKANAEAAKLRQDRGVSKKDLVFLFVGRFTDRKRVFDLLRAYERLQKEFQTVWLFMVGDGPERQRLDDYVRCAKIKNIVFPGFLNTSEIPKYYALSDVFVLPSEYDPSPKAINEAMLFGLPCIVSSGLGIANDLVRHGETGYVFKTGDVDALHEHMREFAMGSAQKNAMAANALARVAKWSPEANAEGVIRALDYCHGRG